MGHFFKCWFRLAYLLFKIGHCFGFSSGSPVSFSNPIVWHPGQSLTRNGEPRRNSRGVYESFFHWFDDHSSPGMDEIAQVHYNWIVNRGGQISSQGIQIN